jgi:hypothetical protein
MCIRSYRYYIRSTNHVQVSNKTYLEVSVRMTALLNDVLLSSVQHSNRVSPEYGDELFSTTRNIRWRGLMVLSVSSSDEISCTCHIFNKWTEERQFTRWQGYLISTVSLLVVVVLVYSIFKTSERFIWGNEQFRSWTKLWRKFRLDFN